MFTIKSATGKEFNSDYATKVNSPPLAFIRIVGEDKEALVNMFSNGAELPFEGYEEFVNLVDIEEERNGLKLVLEP